MRAAALLLLLALAGTAAALEAATLHSLEGVDRRSECHDLKHRKRTLKLIKVGRAPRPLPCQRSAVLHPALRPANAAQCCTAPRQLVKPMYLLLLPARCRAVKAAVPDVPMACSLANPEQETAFSGVFRYLANGTEFKKVTKFEASGGFLGLCCWTPGWGVGRAEAVFACGTPPSPTSAWLHRLAGLARVKGEFYAVFDNSMALGHLDDRFRFR